MSGAPVAMTHLQFKRADEVVAGSALMSATNRLTAPSFIASGHGLLAGRFGASS